MAHSTIVYWRDIPAQIIVRQGRRRAARELPPRFLTAVDAAAMACGAKAAGDYMDQWRHGEPTDCGDDLEAEAGRLALELTDQYDTVRLARLVRNGGREDGGS